MSYLLKLQHAADTVRKKKAAKGFFEYSGTVSPMTGGNSLHGIPPTKGTSVPLLAGIQVESVSLRAIEYSSGALMAGDIKVSGISRIQFPDDTFIGSLGNVWTFVGPRFSGDYGLIKGELKRFDTEWIAVLRLKAPR